MPKGDYLIGKADPLDGTTPIANLLLEALARAKLSGGEKGAVLYLWRQTYGWTNGAGGRRKEAEISLASWASAIGANITYASRVLKTLVDQSVIQRKDRGQGKGYTYTMNPMVKQWACLDWKALSKQASVIQEAKGHEKKQPLPERATLIL